MGKYLNGYRVSDPPAPGWSDWDVIDEGYREFDYSMRTKTGIKRYGDSPQDYGVDVLRDKAVQFIHSSAAAHQPFFLEVATFAPHKPATPAPRYVGVDGTTTFPKTPAFNKLPRNAPAWLRGRVPFNAVEEGRAKSIFLRRVRAVLAVDDLLARVRQELQRLGIAKNTYVVFSSDNGYHIGDYRLPQGKQTAFDTDINVPLVVAGPSIPAGRTDTRMLSSIDLAPTFEALAGLPAPATVDGVNALPVWQDRRGFPWQRAVLVEHHNGGKRPGDPDSQIVDPPSYEAVRTAHALYVEYANGDREYYDTDKDPWELDNVPQQAPRALQIQLHAMQTCTGVARCQAAAGG
jgi:arylsulfatase A-like enzyme